jgi:hypothetical protein
MSDGRIFCCGMSLGIIARVSAIHGADGVDIVALLSTIVIGLLLGSLAVVFFGK